MARKQKTAEVKTINTLNFSKDCKVDQMLISIVNTFCSLPENEGIPPTSVVRNYLIRNMQEDIRKSRKKKQAS